MSKILSKSNQFNFYKEKYRILSNDLKKIKEKNEFLQKEVNLYSKLIDEFKEGYKLNLQNDSPLSKKNILYVLHSGSGGTPKNVKDIVDGVNEFFNCYILISNKKELILYKFHGNRYEKIKTWNLISKWFVEKTSSEDFLNIYINILINFSIDLVHIHHLVFHSLDLPYLCHELNIPIILSLHDFYLICPTYTLLDDENNYCKGECCNSNPSISCSTPMLEMTEIDNMKNFVFEWREKISKFIVDVDFIIAPSYFMKDIFMKVYEIDENKFKIIEHGINLNNFERNLFEIPSSEKPTKILFLGNINSHKGSYIIKELYELDKNDNLDFHFLGNMAGELKDIGIHHGVYEYEKLSLLIKEIKPSFIGIFSKCPESYCYTLSESWAMGIPVLVNKIGSLKFRLLENGGGWFINDGDLEETYSLILSIISNTDEYCLKQEEINDIYLNSTKEMANRYCKIYKQCLL